MFVILDKEEYINKLTDIINDETKFERINADPTERIQRKVNNLISTSNATSGDKLTPIVGSYTPGYLYGNVKTHKENNPLRPMYYITSNYGNL
jgi:hypothetical protein